MNDPHVAFIVIAYGVTFLVVGAAIAVIALRHRALKRALARLGDDEIRSVS